MYICVILVTYILCSQSVTWLRYPVPFIKPTFVTVFMTACSGSCHGPPESSPYAYLFKIHLNIVTDESITSQDLAIPR
jgi:hypothetical protein